MVDEPLRIRSADDPHNPEAVVIERFEQLQLDRKRFTIDPPMGWAVIAWHPNRASAIKAAEESKAKSRKGVERAEGLLAQLDGAPFAPEPPDPAPDFGMVVWRWYQALGTDARDAIDRMVGQVGMAKLVDMLHRELERADDALVPSLGERIAKVMTDQWEAVIARFGERVES